MTSDWCAIPLKPWPGSGYHSVVHIKDVPCLKVGCPLLHHSHSLPHFCFRQMSSYIYISHIWSITQWLQTWIENLPFNTCKVLEQGASNGMKMKRNLLSMLCTKLLPFSWASIHTGDRPKIIMLHIKRKSHKNVRNNFPNNASNFWYLVNFE